MKSKSWGNIERFIVLALKDKQKVPTWNFGSFMQKAEIYLTSLGKNLIELLNESDRYFKKNNFPSDPILYGNWDNFRPLRISSRDRLSREEDWSDWLAYLIEYSKGYFSNYLLFKVFSCKKIISVHREFPVKDRRVDIVIEWGDSDKSTIEIKLNDTSYEKTYETVEKFHKHFHEKKYNYSDFILIPESFLNKWNTIKNAVEHSQKYDFTIHTITWSYVSSALRKSMFYEPDTIWKNFAFVFSGMIESKVENYLNIEKLCFKNSSKKIYNEKLLEQYNMLSNFVDSIK